MTQVNVGGTLHLNPEQIFVGQNIRFGLKQLRIDTLAENILEMGRVLQNVTIEPLAEPVDGKEYQLTTGFYRHAAVAKLNSQEAGLTIPCTVESPGSALERLKTQVSENVQREDMTCMDKAIAIRQLMDAGVPRSEICKTFATPGGRKGLKMQPASNAFINMMLSFLDFPKNIQEKLHDGRLQVSTGYQLRKAPKEKWEIILAEAEKDRVGDIEKAEAEEAKFLEASKKSEAAQLKAQEDTKALESARELHKKAAEDRKTRLEAATTAYKNLQVVKGTKEEKAKAREEWAKLDADSKLAAAVLQKTEEAVVKLEKRVEMAKETAKERAEKLAEARKSAGKNGKAKTGPTSTDVKKATAKVDGAGHVALNASEMRKVVESLQLPGSFAKVKLIGEAMASCFAGVITDKALLTKLAIITGEKAEAKPKGKAAEAKEK